MDEPFEGKVLNSTQDSPQQEEAQKEGEEADKKKKKKKKKKNKKKKKKAEQETVQQVLNPYVYNRNILYYQNYCLQNQLNLNNFLLKNNMFIQPEGQMPAMYRTSYQTYPMMPVVQTPIPKKKADPFNQLRTNSGSSLDDESQRINLENVNISNIDPQG
jgi:hypothetical protein